MYKSGDEKRAEAVMKCYLQADTAAVNDLIPMDVFVTELFKDPNIVREAKILADSKRLTKETFPLLCKRKDMAEQIVSSFAKLDDKKYDILPRKAVEKFIFTHPEYTDRLLALIAKLNIHPINFKKLEENLALITNTIALNPIVLFDFFEKMTEKNHQKLSPENIPDVCAALRHNPVEVSKTLLTLKDRMKNPFDDKTPFSGIFNDYDQHFPDYSTTDPHKTLAVVCQSITKESAHYLGNAFMLFRILNEGETNYYHDNFLLRVSFDTLFYKHLNIILGAFKQAHHLDILLPIFDVYRPKGRDEDENVIIFLGKLLTNADHINTLGQALSCLNDLERKSDVPESFKSYVAINKLLLNADQLENIVKILNFINIKSDGAHSFSFYFEGTTLDDVVKQPEAAISNIDYYRSVSQSVSPYLFSEAKMLNQPLLRDIIYCFVTPTCTLHQISNPILGEIIDFIKSVDPSYKDRILMEIQSRLFKEFTREFARGYSVRHFENAIVRSDTIPIVTSDSIPRHRLSDSVTQAEKYQVRVRKVVSAVKLALPDLIKAEVKKEEEEQKKITVGMAEVLRDVFKDSKQTGNVDTLIDANLFNSYLFEIPEEAPKPQESMDPQPVATASGLKADTRVSVLSDAKSSSLFGKKDSESFMKIIGSTYFQEFSAKTAREQKKYIDDAMKDTKGEVGISTHMITTCIKEFLVNTFEGIKIHTASIAPQKGVAPAAGFAAGEGWDPKEALKTLVGDPGYADANYVCLTMATLGGTHAVAIVIDRRRNELFIVDPLANHLGQEDARRKIQFSQKDIPKLKELTIVIPPVFVDQQSDQKSCGVYDFLNSVGIIAARERKEIVLKNPGSDESVFLPVTVSSGEGLVGRSPQCLDNVLGAMTVIYEHANAKELAAAPKKTS